ncbi:hypothetical protein ACWIUH_11905, partial [Ursidibacter arcticus]
QAQDKDPNAADRLVSNFNDTNVNAGDILFRPGHNNVKLAISYTKTPVGTTQAEEKAVYGKLNEQTGEWTFHTADNGGGTAVNNITKVVGQDGYVYYRIPADEVADNTAVTVVGTNDAAQTFNVQTPETVSNSSDPQLNPKLATVGISTTDMADKTDKAVSTPVKVTQDSASTDVKVGLTPNADNSDVSKVAVKFNASHLKLETAKALGLKVNQPANPDAAPDSQGAKETVANEQFIVGVKQPNGKWTLQLVDAPNLDEALKTPVGSGVTEIPNVASINPTSGEITLKKDVVSGGSRVDAKGQDPYGNPTDENLTTKHTNPTQGSELVVADKPLIEDLGFGHIVVTPAGNNEKMEITGFDGKSIVVTKTDGKYTISPTTIQGVSFDETTGRVTLTTPTAKTITAKGIIGDGTGTKTATTEPYNIDPAKDPSPETADPIINIVANAKGEVEIEPGLDNREVTVSYFGTNGPKQVKLTKGNNGTWTAPSGENDFTFSNGKIILSGPAVKDKTMVVAQGKNKVGVSNKAVSVFTNVDDQTPDQADAPTISKGTEGVDIAKGGDNQKVVVTYTPKGTNKPVKTLTAILKEGGQDGGNWELQDEKGLLVSPTIATVGKDGKITIKEPLKPQSDVNAKGYNIQAEEAANKYSVPAEGPKAPDPVTPKPGNKPAEGPTGAAGTDDGEGNPITNSVAPPTVTKNDRDMSVPAYGQDSNELRIYQNNDADAFMDASRIKSTYKTAFKVYETDNSNKAHILTITSTYGNDGSFSGFSFTKADIDDTKDSSPLGNASSYPGSKITNKEMDYFIIPESQNGKLTGSYYIKSNGKFRLINDSPLESTETGYAPGDAQQGGGRVLSDKLQSRVYFQNNSTYDASKANTTAGDSSTSQGAELVDATPPTLKTDVSGKKGAVEINPQGNTTLIVRYTDENYNVKSAILELKNNAWTVTQGDANDFELNGNTNPIIKANSLYDNLKDGVIVKGTKAGAAESAEVKATPGADDLPPPAPTNDLSPPREQPTESPFAGGRPQPATPTAQPQPAQPQPQPQPAQPQPVQPQPVPQQAKPAQSLAEAMSNIDRNREALNTEGDVAFLPSALIKNVREKEGYRALKALMKERGGILHTVTTNTEEFTFSGNKNDVLRINGTVGDTTKAGRASKGIKLNLGEGDDVVVLLNKLGGNNVVGKERSAIDLGSGHDLLAVGTINPNFVLYENKNAKELKDRYVYLEKNQSAPNGYTKVEGIGDGGGNIKGTTNPNIAGRIINSDVYGGDGNDTLLIEGNNIGDQPAIGTGAKVEMGSGDDTLIIAPNAKYSRTHSDLGSIGEDQSTFVHMGSGNDYLQAVGIDKGGKVYMGDGNDTVKIDRFRGTSTYLDMGNGNDTLNIDGEVSSTGRIDLGAGNDTISFKAATNLWGRGAKETLFETQVDGGEGYDVFILHKPVGEMQSAVFRNEISHLYSKNFKNIEEIKMDRGTAVDISVGDLLQSNNKVLKLTALNKDGAGSIQSKDARLVDLGATNKNDGSDGVFGSARNSKVPEADRIEGNVRWAKVGSQEDAGHTYDIYRAGNYDREVWIEQGQFVII